MTPSCQKPDILERTNSLHKRCGFLDTEHLFMLTINWLKHRKVLDVNVDILENLHNAYRMPKSFFVEKYFEGWYPKIHGPCNYLQSFYVAALI